MVDLLSTLTFTIVDISLESVTYYGVIVKLLQGTTVEERILSILLLKTFVLSSKGNLGKVWRMFHANFQVVSVGGRFYHSTKSIAGHVNNRGHYLSLIVLVK